MLSVCSLGGGRSATTSTAGGYTSVRHRGMSTLLRSSINSSAFCRREAQELIVFTMPYVDPPNEAADGAPFWE